MQSNSTHAYEFIINITKTTLFDYGSFSNLYNKFKTTF